MAEHRLHLRSVLQSRSKRLRTPIVRCVDLTHSISGMPCNRVGQRRFTESRRSTEKGDLLHGTTEIVDVRSQIIGGLLAKPAEGLEFARFLVETVDRSSLFQRVGLEFTK